MNHDDGYAHGNRISESQYRSILRARYTGTHDDVLLAVGSTVESLRGKQWYEVIDGLPIDDNARG